MHFAWLVPLVAFGILAAVLALAWPRKRHAERLRELYQQTQQALRVRDEFLSVCSHELRTPLTSMKLQAQMGLLRISKEGALDPASTLRILSEVERQINRLTHLVEDMLDVARLNTGRLSFTFEDVDLDALLHTTVDEFAPFAAKVGTLIQLQSQGSVIVQGDPHRLEQALGNLLHNAIKYGAGKPIYVRLDKIARQAQVTVSDNGIGIPREDQQRIFECFERSVSVRHYGGLGVGLFIVREILEEHGGNVSVSSEPGHGASFTLHFPLEETTVESGFIGLP